MIYMKKGKRYKKKRKNNKIAKILIIVLLLLTLALVIATAFFVINSCNKSNSEEQPFTSVSTQKEDKTINSSKPNKNNTETQSTAAQTMVSQVEEQTSEVIEETLPRELSEIENTTSYDISQFDFNQLITVDSDGAYAKISFFEKTNRGWTKAKSLDSVNGYVGTQGVSANASEYASYTPEGLYSIGTGFGICDDPGTKLDYFKVTENSFWVDDVNSKFYNQHVEGKNNADWNSAEHLIDCKPEYNYAALIEYNTNPIVQGKGSAFFLHVGYSPTAGCVAIDESTMISVLKWLDKKQSPHILID